MAVRDADLWHQVHAQREDGVPATFLIRDVEPEADRPQIFVIELPYPITDPSRLPDEASVRRLDAFEDQWVEPACEALGWTFVAWKSEDGSFFLYLYGSGDPNALLDTLAPFDDALGFFHDRDPDWSEYAALRDLVDQAQAASESEGEDEDEDGHVHTDACDHDHDHASAPPSIEVIDRTSEGTNEDISEDTNADISEGNNADTNEDINEDTNAAPAAIVTNAQTGNAPATNAKTAQVKEINPKAPKATSGKTARGKTSRAKRAMAKTATRRTRAEKPVRSGLAARTPAKPARKPAAATASAAKSPATRSSRPHSSTKSPARKAGSKRAATKRR